jgi:hypothetical protein
MEFEANAMDEGRVTYTVKESLYLIHNKVDKIDEKVDGLLLAHAHLPAVYVTQSEMNESKRAAQQARRFAVASLIASVGALGTYIGILL